MSLEATAVAGDFRAKVKVAWKRLRGGELTPGRAALSVAVGLAIGVTPLWGFHLPLVLLVCVPLRLDAPVAYLAANISIPPIAPFLTMAELEIGAFLLTGQALPMDLATVRASGVGLFAREITAGTLVFSPLMALLGGSVTFVATRLARGERSPTDLDRALDRTAARYAARGSRAAYHYVRSKLASDPVASEIVRLGQETPLGDVVDAGCGRGQLGVLVLEASVAKHVTGFDWDTKKVEVATRASEGLAASFESRSLKDAWTTEGDTVLLVDVLHYLTDDEQEAVLRSAARGARQRVVVRELDPNRGWRSRVTRFQEWLTTGAGYNRGARVNARPIAGITRVLEDEGFAVEVSPCWGGTPFSNVLVVGRRREGLPTDVATPTQPS